MSSRTYVILLLAIFAAGCASGQFTLGRNNAEADLATCNALASKKQYGTAIECYEIFKSRYRGTEAGQEAEMRIGDNFYNQKEYLLAAESYESFIRNYPLHPQVDYAFYRLGLSYLMESPKQIDRDQMYLGDAIRAFDTQLRLFPNSSFRDATTAQLTEARTRIGRRHFYVGNFYYRTKEYIAAIPRLEQVLAEFPEIGDREKAFAQLVISYAELKEFDNARRVFTAMQREFDSSRVTQRTAKKLERLARKEQG